MPIDHIIKHNNCCIICGNILKHELFKLENAPLVGDFISDVNKDGSGKSSDLTILYCPPCHFAQTKEIVDKNVLFKNYSYNTNHIKTLKSYFEMKAEKLCPLLNDKSRILEIGGNAFPFGRKLIDLGINPFNVYNYDPSDVAWNEMLSQPDGKSYQLINDFFPNDYVDKIGKFDYIFTSNNFAHIENIDDYCKALNKISHNETILNIEVQSLDWLLRNTSYTFFYHEHLYYYSSEALIKLLKNYGWLVSKVDTIPIHGESLSITFTKNPLRGRNIISSE